MKKNVWLFVIMLIILPIVFAQELAFNFKDNENADLKVACKLNGTYCPSNTNCHLTAYYPNSSILVDNQAMDWNPSYFNYTIEQPALQTLGIYRASATCNYTGIVMNIETFYFGIVKKDTQVNDTDFLSEGRILVILSVLSVVFFFLWLIFYIRGKPIHYLFLFIGIILLDCLIYMSYLIADSLSSFYSGVLLTLFRVLLAVTFILIIVMLIDITLKVVKYVEGVKKGRADKMWDELPISNK